MTESKTGSAERAARLQTLNGWIENGQRPSAVAVYGTSVEVVSRILTTGVIAPTSSELHPEDKSWLGDKNLYYGLFLMDGIKMASSNLAVTLETELDQTLGKQRSVADDHAPDDQVRIATYYALQGAIAHSLDIGMDSADIVAGGYRILEYSDPIFVENPLLRFLDASEELTPKELGNITRKLKRKFGKDTQQNLRMALRRKGALLFFNDSLLSHQISIGREDEREIRIASEHPITQDAIDGIQILSPEDHEALMQLI